MGQQRLGYLIAREPGDRSDMVEKVEVVHLIEVVVGRVPARVGDRDGFQFAAELLPLQALERPATGQLETPRLYPASVDIIHVVEVDKPKSAADAKPLEEVPPPIIYRCFKSLICIVLKANLPVVWLLCK